MGNNYRQIEDDWQLAQLLHEPGEEIKRCAFQSVNFTAEHELALAKTYTDCIFMGCTLPYGLKRQTHGCLFFPNMGETFATFRSTLYDAESLYEDYVVGNPDSYKRCFDGRVYQHYLKKGKVASDIKETLARTLHDHSISDALHDYLERWDERKVVGVMGGHGILRTDEQYEQVAHLSKRLTEKGYLMVSGGGPGAMEATHLGAWMAGKSDEEFREALKTVRRVASFKEEGWLDTAFEVRRRFPQHDYESLGIPTWLYGHEPATPLATHIAKYFDNSIREDGILTIAKGGIIFTPGSAGTLQEIFQEAVQNHYLTFGYASPMVFMGVDYWTREVPVYPLIQDLLERGKYKNLLLTLSDEEEEIIKNLY